jgi:SAM-dependent methyltransferase
MTDETIDTTDFWEAASAGWRRRAAHVREWSAPVSHWMVDAINPQPGHRVLELAAGTGETGFLAAELVAPGGGVITTDQAEGMLDGARERARELGLENIEFRAMSAEWLDMPVASVDGVLCRWGYMLMNDPHAALRETRRVLRPGGRVALAVWDALERNPWAAVPGRVLREHGLTPAPEPGAPGPFALGDVEVVRGLLHDTGFDDIELDTIELVNRHPDFDDFWQTRRDLSGVLGGALDSLSEDEQAALRADVEAALADHRAADGSIELPGVTIVAAASA